MGFFLLRVFGHTLTATRGKNAYVVFWEVTPLSLRYEFTQTQTKQKILHNVNNPLDKRVQEGTDDILKNNLSFRLKLTGVTHASHSLTKASFETFHTLVMNAVQATPTLLGTP